MSKKRTNKSFANMEPEGTQEEIENSWKVAENYMYNILNYADKEEVISKEELEEQRRIFTLSRQGPRAHHFIFSKRSKLTSADVLYFLTTTNPVNRLAKAYGVAANEIYMIRRGEIERWKWEYEFVKRLKKMITRKYQEIRYRNYEKFIYSISKIDDRLNKEILMYTTSKLKAKGLRQSVIKAKEYEELVKNNTLDILYPIERIDIL